MTKKYVTALGALFVLIGILGFIPPLTPSGNLFGLLEAGTVHNVVYLLVGIVALAAAMGSATYARVYAQAFGLVFGVVAVLGFLIGEGSVLGFLPVDVYDNVLHTVVALSALYAGFAPEGKASQA